MVRMRGLEPTHREAPDPKSGVSTNFTTSATLKKCLQEDKKKDSVEKSTQIYKSGTPERIRTFDRTLRRRVLYPAELQTQ